MSGTFRQKDFEDALHTILAAAKRQGKTTCLVVSKKLHDRVVGGLTTNRMPQACDAMWRVWREQGGDKSKIIRTTPSGKSSTIELEFFTGIEEHENDPVEFPVTETDAAREGRFVFCKGFANCYVLDSHTGKLWQIVKDEGSNTHHLQLVKKSIPVGIASSGKTPKIKIMSESFRQEQFDAALRNILAKAKAQGKKTCLVVSKDLHKRVVGGGTPNRMVMACSAMWDVWEEQGRDEKKIIHTTPSGKSSTIELEFFT